MSINRSFPSAAAAAAGAVFGVLTGAVDAAPAAAHVTIRADNPQAGARNVTVTFTGQAESRQAGIVSERVLLPTGLSARDIRPVSAPPGWAFTAATDGYTVSGPALRPGVDATYAIMVSQLPTHVTTLVFKTVETYSDGTTLRWVEVPAGGQSEPANPAPVLTLNPAAGPTGTPAPATAATGTSASVQALEPTPARGRSGGARVALAVIAVIAVLVTGGVVAYALFMLRRRPPAV